MAERVVEANRFVDYLFHMDTAQLRTLLAKSDVSMLALSTLYGLDDVNNEGGAINSNDDMRINLFVQRELRAENLEGEQLLMLLLWKENFLFFGLYDDAAPDQNSQEVPRLDSFEVCGDQPA
jgi:hypothetical protein